MYIMRHSRSTPHNHLFMSHKKGIVSIANICTVLLGVEYPPYKAVLIVPKDTDIEPLVPMVAKKLDPTTLKDKFIDAQGNALIKPLDHDTRKSLRVCVLVDGKQQYQDVAIIDTAGNSIMNVRTVNITNKTVENVTEQLCRAFWRDIWHNDVWEDKKIRGVITHQRAMHGLATLSDFNVCEKVYAYGDRGNFCSKTCPGGNLHAVVLYSHLGYFTQPPHVAFYIVLQYAQEKEGGNTRVILYVVYPAANTTPTMKITNDKTMTQLRNNALLQVGTEIRKGTFPARWMAHSFPTAETGLTNNTITLGLP